MDYNMVFGVLFMGGLIVLVAIFPSLMTMGKRNNGLGGGTGGMGDDCGGDGGGGGD